MSKPNDNPIPDNLSYKNKVAAEEVLHKDPSVVILPDQTTPAILPEIHDMVPYRHAGPNGCQQTVFYYTHLLARGEMMLARLARLPNGKRPEEGTPIMCQHCGRKASVLAPPDSTRQPRAPRAKKSLRRR